ncbi:MAG: hypothetical protein CVV23_08450 [Ignavibacteriae bacterium HGW-Ignavibacteriae-2]|jgi:biotin carboxylase|nr:MAG: hypothetical protein CVV23_08450 [Ignavibacteriae bacterium HGW-Ignavibacteriae-2]
MLPENQGKKNKGRKKLAVIGASYLQLPLVNKANDMGIETHCFAWEEGAVCKDVADYFYPISIIEKEKILDKCKEIGINGITSIASDVAVPSVCFVAENMNLISNTVSSSNLCTDKYLMREAFKKNNVNSPKYFKLNKENYRFDDNLVFPVIVKPVDRSGSLGVMLADNKEKFESAVFRACQFSFKKEAIVEEFIDGREVSVETISWEGSHFLLNVTDKVTTNDPYFVEIEHHQPSEIDKKILKRVKDLTFKALTSLNIKYGAGHTEIRIKPNGDIFIIEVGARMGGDFIGSDLVYLSTGYDFLKGVIEVSLNKFHVPEFTENKHSGVFFLSKDTMNTYSIIQERYSKSIVTNSRINDNLNYATCSADRSGYLIYQSDKRIVI